MTDTSAGGAASRPAFSKHRLEGLTDGIYAVAMTLLAIELKFPDSLQIPDNGTFLVELLHLVPRIVSWALSFAILAIFWFSHQKAFHYTRAIDGRLIAINMLMLACVTLLPFSTMLIGTYPFVLSSHVAYALNMTVLALLSIRQIQHVAARAELAHNGLDHTVVSGTAFRCWGLVGCAMLSVAAAVFIPRYASMAYMAMMVITPVSRRLERRRETRAAPRAEPHTSLP